MGTIKATAAYVGVSVTTVSRVLNSKGPISEETILKVNRQWSKEEEIDEMP